MGTRLSLITDAKPSFDEWFVEIDITRWLNGETISNVDFSAKNRSTGSDATTTVLDNDKCTFTDYKIKPFLKSGTDGEKYRATMKITTNNGSKGEFYLEWKIKNL